MVESQQEDKIPEVLKQNVLKASEKTIENGTEVRGYDFNKGLDYEAMFKTYVHTGF